jgi:hypothetical protein
MRISPVVGLFMLAGKVAAYWITGSSLREGSPSSRLPAPGLAGPRRPDADARRGRIHVALIWASDRIARSVKPFLELLD